MTKTEAIRLATELVVRHWGRELELIGAKPPSKKVSNWTVLFKTELRYGPPGAVVDGPTVVMVDEHTLEAHFFASL